MEHHFDTSRAFALVALFQALQLGCAAGVDSGGPVGATPEMPPSFQPDGVSPGAVAQDSRKRLLDHWERTMQETLVPRKGCYRAAFPATIWEEVACVEPIRPAVQRIPDPVPQLVGNRIGWAANAAGITSAQGSFLAVTGVTGETDTVTGNNNWWSLQLNTNRFASTACNMRPGCQAWVQFIYNNQNAANNIILIEYWLLGYGANCPANWNQSGTNCVASSPGTVVAVHQITNLASLTLSGAAVANGLDTVTISTGTGTQMRTAVDSFVNLAGSWNGAEFNVFGLANASQASFVPNNGVTIVARTSVNNGGVAAPTCASGAAFSGWTGEVNSLNLVANSCCTIAGVSPAIVFTESNVAGANLQYCNVMNLVPSLVLLR
jgi:hypothetical protein